jgi:preprotein translocase subunit SecB
MPTMSQLFVKNIRLQQVQFRINPDFHIENDHQAVEIKHNISIKHELCEKSLAVHIVLQTPPIDRSENYPFAFLLDIAGLFELEEGVEPAEIDKIANINCAAIIFPYVREMLADITRRSGFPPLHIQPVNFIKLFKEKSERSS